MKFIFEGIMRLTYLTSRDETATNKELKVLDDLDHIQTYQKDLSRVWKYVNDKWLGIRNHISPAPIAAMQSTGDCDDFASHMYQVSQKYNPILLTYFPWNITKAHTVVVLHPEIGEYKNYYIVINWGRINFFTTKQQVYSHLEGYTGGKIISFHWANYDYEKGKYRGLKEKLM